MTPFKSPKQYLQEKRAAIFRPGTRFLRAEDTARSFTAVVDEVLRGLIASRLGQLRDKFCLIALGGYGRMEMCPYSDVDILILYEPGLDQSLVKKAVAACWDIGLPPGIVVRTLGECRGLLGDDIATDTSYLESRYLYGNAKLFKRLQQEILWPWYRRERLRFTRIMVEAVRGGVFSEKSSLYKVEPHLKEGICALRDIQRIYWGLAVWNRQNPADRQALLAPFPSRDRENFKEGHAFLLGLRHELHMLAGRRLDILELAWQWRVAEIPGIRPATPGQLMKQYFRMVRHVHNFALLFLEYTVRRDSWWTRLRRNLGASQPGPGIQLSDGIFFLKGGPAGNRLEDPLWYLEICYKAASCQASLGMQLRNLIRRQVAEVPDAAFISPAVMRMFRQILALENPVGEILSEMHSTGLLEKLIPEFTPLILRVEYDTYHEYPVDEHTLLMLKKIDHIGREDPLVRDVYAALPDKSLLRLACLLHDIGKGLPGSHPQTGAILAENICDRLGLEDHQKDLVSFLVANHLIFSATAMRFEIEESMLLRFAAQVGSAENLTYLFLLTVFDIRCVSAHALTGWKLKLLKDLFLETNRLFEGGGIPSPQPAEDFSHLAGKWEGESIHFEHAAFEGFERLVVVGRDKAGFLSELIACLTSEGYNILSTRARTLPGNIALDTLHLQPDSSTKTSAGVRLKNVRRKWKQLEGGQVTAGEFIARRFRQYPSPPVRHPGALSPVSVSLDNDTSADYTTIQVVMPDSFGLLYSITSCLAEIGLNILGAKLTTKINLAVDTFYVLGADNRKISSGAEEVCRQIQAGLRMRREAEQPVINQNT